VAAVTLDGIVIRWGRNDEGECDAGLRHGSIVWRLFHCCSESRKPCEMLVDSKHAIELCQRVERLNVLKQFVSNRHSRIQNEVTMHMNELRAKNKIAFARLVCT
jgi:hypothetical protein